MYKTHSSLYRVFFFTDTATPEIYTLSLHDALPIWTNGIGINVHAASLALMVKSITPTPSNCRICSRNPPVTWWMRDRKSTLLNSSHTVISYAVFCLKKKKQHGREKIDAAKPPRREP